MKELETIIKLLDAGYTKSDIDALVNPDVDEVQPDTDIKPVADVEPIHTDNDIKEVDNSEVLGRLDKLEKMLQKNAILTDSVNPKKDTTQDILAGIINPYLNKE